MAVPENATKLGTVGIAYKGAYNELETYKYANAVYYNGSTYIALIDNPAGFPSNDGVNWRYLAQGFLQQAISALTVIDESGILGEVDAEVNAQEFLSKIAELQQGLEDTKANKADILDSLEEVVANTEDGRIMGAKAGAELNSNLTDISNTVTETQNDMTGLFKTTTVSWTGLSISANSSKYNSKSISLNGYTPVAVCGWWLGGSAVPYPYDYRVSANTAYCALRNSSSSALSDVSVSITVLWVKSKFI